MEIVTAEMAVEMIRKQVEKKGSDFVYEKPKYTTTDPNTGEDVVEEAYACKYSDAEGKPSCIVGHVLAEEFPEIFQEASNLEWDKWYGAGGRGLSVPTLLDGRPEFLFEAVQVLRKAQRVQDFGGTWGEALEGVQELLND